jgi:hypothetical protein
MNNTNNNSNRIITHCSADRSWAIHHGDINNVLPTLPPVTFDGSEMIAALSAGWDHVAGIEWHEPYVATARQRLPKTKDGFARPA